MPQAGKAQAFANAGFIESNSGPGKMPTLFSKRTRGNAPIAWTFATDSGSRNGHFSWCHFPVRQQVCDFSIILLNFMHIFFD